MLKLLLILACSFIIGTIVFYDATKSKKKKQIKPHPNQKYKMPSVFWDEYNWLSLKIYEMKLSDCDNVQHKINQFIYKYEQFIEFQTFNDRVGCLLSDYQKKVKQLLNNNHLHNGTTIKSK
jgi:hypothetical protein